ncbi:MAG: ABC transporter substrate-binding protein [Deltaproteobacteria bacterium]|nr:ABC transporter substrate-binding protein [Deltaproteobacteria bacterium]
MRALKVAGLLALGVMAGCVEKKKDGGGTTPPAPAPASAAAPAPAEETVLFGVYGSMTGAEATFGISTKQGIDLAVQELNAGGGVLGKKVKTIVYDDQGKPEEAVTTVTKLVTQDKVHVVLGEVASSRSLAAAPICQNNKVPMISPSSTNPRVTETGDYIFRVCFIDPFQGTVMAEFAAAHLKVKNVAIFRDKGSDYSMGLADYFQKAFEVRGGKIVADESYSANDQDFKSQLTAMKGKKPEAIFVPGYYTQVATIIRQARELKMEMPFLGGDGWESSKLFEIGGKALDGCYFSNHTSNDDPRPELQAFIKKYTEQFKEPPDSLAVLGYDSAMLAADAIRRAGKLDRTAMRDELAKTKGYKGVSGTVNIDEQRNATKPAVVLKIQDGKASFVTSIAP